MPVDEKIWEKIAEDAIRKAESVDCDGTEFVEGLKIIEVVVRERKELAAEEFGEDG